MGLVEQHDNNPTERTEVDQLLKALSSQTRRHIVTSLAKNNRSSSSDLAIEELGIATADEVEAREVLLYHQHLPRLDDVGLIEWDEDTGVATRGPWFEDSRPLIESIVELEDERAGGKLLRSSG